MSNTDTNQATDDTQKASTRTLSEQHAQHGTATSPIISDTNQASEDGLRTAILANLKHAYFNAKTDTAALANGLIPNHDHALGILENKSDDLMQMAQDLMRTEKLKLLAEVRERVVGEPIPYGWDDDIDDMTKWKYYTGYKSNANDFVAGYNRSRAERLEQLTKLEAEL